MLTKTLTLCVEPLAEQISLPRRSPAPDPTSIPLLADVQALVDNPSLYEDLGFTAPEGSFLADPCIRADFAVDGEAEIMGTQVSQRRYAAARTATNHQSYMYHPRYWWSS